MFLLGKRDDRYTTKTHLELGIPESSAKTSPLSSLEYQCQCHSQRWPQTLPSSLPNVQINENIPLNCQSLLCTYTLAAVKCPWLSTVVTLHGVQGNNF